MSGGWSSQADGGVEGDHPPEGPRGTSGSAQAKRGRPGIRPAVACLGLDGLGAAGPNFQQIKVSPRLTLAEGGKRSAPAGGSAERPLPWDVAAGPGTECGDETG
jgi:hypothetical protein